MTAVSDLSYRSLQSELKDLGESARGYAFQFREYIQREIEKRFKKGHRSPRGHPSIDGSMPISSLSLAFSLPLSLQLPLDRHPKSTSRRARYLTKCK